VSTILIGKNWCIIRIAAYLQPDHPPQLLYIFVRRLGRLLRYFPLGIITVYGRCGGKAPPRSDGMYYILQGDILCHPDAACFRSQAGPK